MPDEKEGVLIKLLREATSFEIGLVAFLVLPPILLAWIPILNQIIPEESKRTRAGAYITVLIIYAALVGIMVRGKVKADKQKREEAERQSQREQEETEKERILREEEAKLRAQGERVGAAKSIILTRLRTLNHDITSYEKLRRDLHKEDWSDDFFHSIVDAYPNMFAHIWIHGGKPGLKVIKWEE